MNARRKRPYHHGNLASALADEALRIIHSAGLSAVSLRELGKRLGVSRSAAYRHYADKEALLAALAQRGFEALSRTMADEARRRAAASAKSYLDALAFGYVRFAREEPAYFRLIFGRVGFEREHPALRTAGETAFATLKDAVAACQRDGALRGTNPDAAALLCWSTVHGFASLLIDGHIDLLDDELQIEGLLHGLYFGLRAAPPELAPSL